MLARRRAIRRASKRHTEKPVPAVALELVPALARSGYRRKQSTSASPLLMPKRFRRIFHFQIDRPEIWHWSCPIRIPVFSFLFLRGPVRTVCKFNSRRAAKRRLKQWRRHAAVVQPFISVDPFVRRKIVEASRSAGRAKMA